MLGKSVLISGKGYVRISLTKEETEKALDELLEANMKEYQKVMSAVGKSTIAGKPSAVKLLFDKQAMASFTYLQIKLDEKIDAERKKAG